MEAVKQNPIMWAKPEDIYAKCDFITIHVPLLESTRQMINAEAIANMKDGVVILNFCQRSSCR